MNQEEHERIVNAAMTKLKKIKPPDEPIDIERLRQRGMEIVKAVSIKALAYDKQVRDLGQTHDAKTAAQVVSGYFFDGFAHWSKDELLTLLVLIHTETAVAEMI